MDLRTVHTEYNNQMFARLAPNYDRIEKFIGFLREKAADKIKLREARILDFACGTGNLSIALADRGHVVTGLDLSPDMLAIAKNKIGLDRRLEFISGDTCAAPFLDSSFDAATISLALHDMPPEIRLQTLKEMSRVVKPGGQIIIIDYARPKNKLISWLGQRLPLLWESKYFSEFKKTGLEYYLDQVGLKINHQESFVWGNVQLVECINLK